MPAMDSDERSTKKERQKKVNENKAWLVKQGDAIGEKAKANKDWKGQLRNLWDVARAETEPEVVLNFLRYQKGKKRDKNNWTHPENVFDPLMRDLKECIRLAGEDRELTLELMRHLLGYTYRSFTFHEVRAS
jgi:hypothetical protein